SGSDLCTTIRIIRAMVREAILGRAALHRATFLSTIDDDQRSRTHPALAKDSPERDRFSRPAPGRSWRFHRSADAIIGPSGWRPDGLNLVLGRVKGGPFAAAPAVPEAAISISSTGATPPPAGMASTGRPRMSRATMPTTATS
ncbi:MAG: hypothetical protein V3S87_02740, partial [Alphaproteobacteria bacterium]